ncbi:MAG: DUF624 domain-containing protein [Burkholderiales bacterium]
MRYNEERGVDEMNKRPRGGEKAEKLAQSLSARAWLLIRLNVLFLVFCIPVVTIPASVSAMTKVLMNLVMKDDCDLWHDFLREFRHDFLGSLVAGLVMGMLMAAVFFTGYAIYSFFDGFASSLGIAFIIFFEALLYIAACYLFAIITTVDISLKPAIKNSLLLALIEIKRNSLLIIPLALLAACVLLYPASLPLFVFIMFSLCQYIVCNVVPGAIKKRIIDPFYAESKEGSSMP